MSADLGRPVGEQRSRAWLRWLTFTAQRPRPRAVRADAAAQAACKKGALDGDDVIAEVRAAHPAAVVEVWAEDEHRLRLLPRPGSTRCRVWAPRGRRHTAWGRRGYRWRSVDGVVRLASGRTWWDPLPTVDAAGLAVPLAGFARDQGLGPQRRAGPGEEACGAGPRCAEGLPPVFLPPASLELKPADRPWSPVDEAVANRAAADPDALTDLLADRCRALWAAPETVRAHTRFAW